jgi:Bacterial Ig-like domain (group 2)/Chitobiase/beta-hexosaminidase C-terminal domain
MRIPPMPQVCSVALCVFLILITGCSNPSSQNLASLTVTATPATVSVGSSSVLKAVAHLSDGTTQDVTSSTQWTLSNPALATMKNGALTAVAPGAVMVQAAYVEATPAGASPASASTTPENLSASTQVTISSAPSTPPSSPSTPTISWSAPAAIAYGAALSSTQLNATANVAGTFVYTPAAGAVLKAGTQTLSAVFTPTDTSTYSSATATVQLTVNQATPTITWAAPAGITTGTALGATQLDATANVPGTFVYNPAAGAVLTAGTQQLTAVFSPTDTTDYASATAHTSLAVAAPTAGPVAGPAPVGCGGPTINVNPGMSVSTLSSTITSAPNCAVIVFAAGTYGPLTSTITIPCSVSLTGPTVPYSQTPNQTATIVGSSSFVGWAFQTTSGCSQSQTIQYLEWNGKLPSNGGGFLEMNAGTTNITVQNNWLHGANAPGASEGGQSNQSAQIWMNGSASSATTSNVNILWNIFGSTSFADCATAMNDTSSAENDGGGGCNGVGMHNNVSNITIKNNIFHWLEEPIKTYESPSSGSCNNVVIDYNSVTNFSRIGYETQCYTPGPTLMYIQYNNWGTRYGSQQTYDVSAANGCGNTYTGICETHTDYNVDLQAAQGAADVGLEIWGGGTTKTTANGNLLQGYLYNAITWSVSGNFQFNNNTFNIVNNGDNTSCSSQGGGYFNEEASNGPAFTPTCTGNTFSNNITGTYPSAAPTISPASGTFSGSQVVTITNPGTDRDVNTTDWCTTDGSTPTPGSGTAVGYYNGGTLTVTSTTTVKCVGMWGALNQPYSYPSGYAYVPSAVVSSSLTPAVVKQTSSARSAVSGTDTVAATEAAGSPAAAGSGAAAGAELASVAVVPAQATVAIGSTTQLKAIATFSDGSTKDVTTDFAWSSSDTRTITAASSGLLSGLATGKATITGSYQGHQASVPAVSSIGQVNWSSPIVITEAGTYSGNWQSTDSKTPAVTVATTAPVVIENSHISSAAGLIKTSVAGADVTVRNSVGLAVNSAVKGQANGVFLDVSSPARLDVENNYVENAGGGVLVHGYSGNRDGQQTIVIRANRARNLNGLLSDGNGGYLPGVGSNRSVSNFIQLDKVQAVPGVDVGWNEVINYPGRSLVADNIAVKSSSGTPNQPLEIHDTYIQGAYPYTAAQANYDGGGIKTEGSPDDSAQQAPAFNSIHDNQVVGTVNYGIAFTAGHDNIAANNRVISSGMLADGTRIAAQHVGMANGDVNGANASLYNNTMHDNLIGWTCWTSSCSQSGYRKDQSFPAAPGDYSANTVVAQPITPTMENNEYQIWLNKTASAGIAVGPSF